jgi:BirA family transcriptional regulator, biotin operon repressor / biotin---[acetyl-CoA-carboxylase] ligase
MDVAHELARAGAPPGTVVIADTQTAGRGRGGATWISGPGRGIWLTIIERPHDPSVLDVLSLRVGLGAARALDLFASEPVRIKWPNDLYVENAKLAGNLIEARWRDLELEWVAIGLGVNVRTPTGISASALEEGASRVEILAELVPEIRAAAALAGLLTTSELDEFGGRDFARGHACLEPGIGIVKGISEAGELLVAIADAVVKFRTGSLVLDDPAHYRFDPSYRGSFGVTEDTQAEKRS